MLFEKQEERKVEEVNCGPLSDTIDAGVPKDADISLSIVITAHELTSLNGRTHEQRVKASTKSVERIYLNSLHRRDYEGGREKTAASILHRLRDGAELASPYKKFTDLASCLNALETGFHDKN